MKKHKPPIPTADWLKWLGERRDRFLIGGAVLYGLGYIVWSYNAWRNHLGQLPAIEFQYLMSGLILAAIIGMALAAITFFSSMRDKAIAFSKKYGLLYWIILVVIFAVPSAISFGVAAADKRWLHLGWTKEQRNHVAHIEKLPTGDDPKQPLHPRAFAIVKKEGRTGTLSRQFGEILADAGLVVPRSHDAAEDGKGRGARRKVSEISFHALRHTAVSMLKTAGVSDAIARDLAGHESAEVSRLYTHIEDQAKRRAVNKLPTLKAS